MTATVIPHTAFLEARARKIDPKGYASRKIFNAIDRQVKANQSAKPLLIGNTPVIDEDFDELPVMDRGDRDLRWGPQRDPGDET
ncbi:hypothetical protein [Microvirga lotononidis]|uniref:Uncharacterized protein n=1 Tax=Microvirga lotononidis TaxID=864069 RepID=I4YP46_9HYPH|nr:hypothetical protein [Microvirga lotononidis]EIM25738.1 hypothetical protein MicloDRAFT_00064650 [Microvirga lotononidis]WQO25668.1 hypothetical protein U0023_13170 [Microvirga lotononidis]